MIRKVSKKKKYFYVLTAIFRYTNSMHNYFLFGYSNEFKCLLAPDLINRTLRLTTNIDMIIILSALDVTIFVTFIENST